MRLKWAHLCDYAAPGDGGKPMAIGIFDAFQFPAVAEAPFVTRGFYLTFGLEASAFDPSPCRIVILIQDGDMNELGGMTLDGFFFVPSRDPGRPRIGFAASPINGVEFPDVGDYSFSIFLEGEGGRRDLLGDVPLSVFRGTQGAAGPTGAAAPFT